MKDLINLLTSENIDINVKSSNEFGRINIDGSFVINGKKTVFHIYQTEYLSDTMNDLRFAEDLDQVREVFEDI